MAEIHKTQLYRVQCTNLTAVPLISLS